jgi:hypothetical protein
VGLVVPSRIEGEPSDQLPVFAQHPDVESSVSYGPITRYDVADGYLNPDGLLAVAASLKEEQP